MIFPEENLVGNISPLKIGNFVSPPLSLNTVNCRLSGKLKRIPSGIIVGKLLKLNR